MLLPDPAMNAYGDQRSSREEREVRTFAVDPQEGASRLPFRKDTALKEPFGCSAVVNFACDVVIRRGIWGSNPSSKALLQLGPCGQVNSTEPVAKGMATNVSCQLRYLKFAEEQTSHPFHLANIRAIRIG